MTTTIRLPSHLIIHIGQHKTGSTSLQYAFSEIKENDTLIYPTTGGSTIGHIGLAMATNPYSASGSNFRQLKDDLEQELEGKLSTKPSHETLPFTVLSCEFFSAANEIKFDDVVMSYRWRKLNEIAQIFRSSEIVYYTREQAESIESRLQQAAKSRLCLTDSDPTQLLENLSLDYDRFDQTLGAHFPNSTITPRIYSRTELTRGDICADFSSIIGGYELVSKRANVSVVSAELMQEWLSINRLSIELDAKMALKRAAGAISSSAAEYAPKFGLKGLQVEAIRSFFKESNERFFRRYPCLRPFDEDQTPEGSGGE